MRMQVGSEMSSSCAGPGVRIYVAAACCADASSRPLTACVICLLAGPLSQACFLNKPILCCQTITTSSQHPSTRYHTFCRCLPAGIHWR